MLYKIADVVMEVEHLFEYSKNIMQDYRISEGMPELKIAIDPSEIDAICEREKADKEMAESLAILRAISQYLTECKQGIIFHSSAISVGDSAVLFCAPSGTGKSTHSRMWRETFDDVVMVNDDKPFVRCFGDEYYVYGTPWNGKHGLGNNIKRRIKAICFIERGEEPKVEKMSKFRAIPILLNQTLRPNEEKSLDKCLNIIDGILRSVEVYKITANISHECAKVARKVILEDL